MPSSAGQSLAETWHYLSGPEEEEEEEGEVETRVSLITCLAEEGGNKSEVYSTKYVIQTRDHIWTLSIGQAVFCPTSLQSGQKGAKSKNVVLF